MVRSGTYTVEAKKWWIITVTIGCLIGFLVLGERLVFSLITGQVANVNTGRYGTDLVLVLAEFYDRASAERTIDWWLSTIFVLFAWLLAGVGAWYFGRIWFFGLKPVEVRDGKIRTWGKVRGELEDIKEFRQTGEGRKALIQGLQHDGAIRHFGSLWSINAEPHEVISSLNRTLPR